MKKHAENCLSEYVRQVFIFLEKEILDVYFVFQANLTLKFL